MKTATVLEQIVQQEFQPRPEPGLAISARELLGLEHDTWSSTLGSALMLALHSSDNDLLGPELLNDYDAGPSARWTPKLRLLSVGQRQALLFVLQHIQPRLHSCEDALPHMKRALLDHAEVSALVSQSFTNRDEPPPEPHFMTGHFDDFPKEVVFDGEIWALLPEAFHHFLPAYLQHALTELSEQTDWLDLRHAADNCLDLSWQFHERDAAPDSIQTTRLNYFSVEEKRACLLVFRHLMLLAEETDPLEVLQDNLAS